MAKLDAGARVRLTRAPPGVRPKACGGVWIVEPDDIDDDASGWCVIRSEGKPPRRNYALFKDMELATDDPNQDYVIEASDG